MLRTVIFYIIKIYCTKHLNLYYEEKDGCLIGKNLSDREIRYDKEIIQLMFDNIWEILIKDPRFDEAFIDDEFIPRKWLFNIHNEINIIVFNKIMSHLSSSYKDNKEEKHNFLYLDDLIFANNMAEEVFKMIEVLYLCDDWGEFIQSPNKIRFYDHINELIRNSFTIKKSLKPGCPPRIKYKNCINQEFLNSLRCANKYEGHISIPKKIVKSSTKKTRNIVRSIF